MLQLFGGTANLCNSSGYLYSEPNDYYLEEAADGQLPKSNRRSNAIDLRTL